MRVPPKEFYKDAERRNMLVFRACEYIRDDCQMCPAKIDTKYGGGKQGCRAIAEELIAIIAYDLKMNPDNPDHFSQDNDLLPGHNQPSTQDDR